MTALNKLALREAAEKATPGEWKRMMRNSDELMTTFHGVAIGNVFVELTTGKRDIFDAEFIAAANPSTVLSLLDELEAAEVFCIARNACRDAMLHGKAEPVTTAYKLPEGWIPVSERIPEDDEFVYIWPRPDFGIELHVGQYCECHPKGDGWYAQVYEQNYGIEWHPITVTHWMPLPAAPQQEDL